MIVIIKLYQVKKMSLKNMLKVYLNMILPPTQKRQILFIIQVISILSMLDYLINY